MKTYRAYKYRLYPTYKQHEYLNRCIGCGRLVYNWALGLRIDAYKEDGTTLSIRNEAIRIKNDKGEPTPKNLRRLMEMKKITTIGVVSRANETEMQSVNVCTTK